jgi:membrane dipeptidase
MPPVAMPLRGLQYTQRSLGERSTVGHLDLPRMLEGKVDCQVFAVYIPPIFHDARVKRVIQMIDVFFSEIEKNSKMITFNRTYESIIKTQSEHKIAAVLSVEGGEALQGDLGVLRILYKLGVRLLTLTHSIRNKLGDGCNESSKSGLTQFGIQVVQEMNKLGMIVDVSHINEEGFWDVINISKDPVIASHSNSRAICNHERNLTDDQIRAIAKKGGVIGVTFVRNFLTSKPEEASMETVLSHIDHIKELVGVKHIGIGSDYDGMGPGPRGLEHVGKVTNITKGLIMRGYSNDEIEKVLGGNFLRIFKQILVK